MTSPTPNQESASAVSNNRKTLRNLRRAPTLIGLNNEMQKLKPQTSFGESFNVSTPKKTTSRVPVFLGPDGTFYDIDYFPLSKKDIGNAVVPPLDTNNNTPPSFDVSSSAPAVLNGAPPSPVPQTEIDLLKQFQDSFPQPAQFDSFFDYEQSLLEWKLRMEAGLANLRLPNIMGRKYNRPRVVDFQNNALEDTITSRSTSSLENSLPENHTPSPSTPTQISEIPADGEPSMAAIAKEEEEENEEYEVDPWDSILVPQQPQPTDYDTFVDYEEALCRWALLCRDLPTIPPHADQLKELIPIQPIAALEVVAQQQSTTSSTSSSDPPMEWKVRLVLSELPFFEPFRERRPLIAVDPIVDAVYPPIKEFRNFTVAERKVIEDIFAKRLQAQAETLAKYGRHNAPLLPRIHGTLPKPYTSSADDEDGMFGGSSGSFGGFGGGGSGSGGLGNGSGAFGGGFGSPGAGSVNGFGTYTTAGTSKIKNRPKMLRRTDLSKEMLEKCLDCLPEYDGVKVEFKIPEFDIDNIDLLRIDSDSSYKDQLQKQVVHMQHADRNDFLNSWYYPTVPLEAHHRHREFVNYLMTSTPASKFDVAVLSDILAGDMYLDKFQDLLSESKEEEEDGSSKSYLQVFLGCITPDNFSELLALFERHESRLLHSKLAAFIIETTQSAKAKVLVERLIARRDVKSLSFVAYGMTFFNEVPVDIYPWHDDTYFALKKFLGPAVEPFMIIFCYYYVNLICQTINHRPFLFVGLSHFINETRKNLASQLGTALQSQPDFVGKYVFRGMAHRSQKISHMFLFVLVQLLTQQNLESPLVQACLRSEATRLINNTKDLTDSKYVHVQLTARRIFDILTKDPWQEFIYADYQANPDQILKDMLRPAPRNGKVSTLCSIVLDLCVNALNGVTKVTDPTKIEAAKKKISFLLDEVLFHTVFQHVSKNAHAIDLSTVALSKLLYHLAETYLKLNSIIGNQSVKQTVQRRQGALSLTLSPLDIQKILTFISDVSNPDQTITFGVRKNMLKTLRQLLKSPQIFEFVRKENDFYQRLTNFCRDGTIMSSEVNREAWKILSTIIYYHQGTIDYMNKSSQNLINPILDLIATFSPNVVVTNGLLCIARLFSMLASEQRKPIRKEIKTVEKDLKILTSIFTERRLFIKVHMLYRRDCATMPGTIWFAVANFYNVIQTTEGCKKLLRNTIKSPDYKEGLENIRNMYSPTGGMIPEEPISPVQNRDKPPAKVPPPPLKSEPSKLAVFNNILRSSSSKLSKNKEKDKE